MTQPRQSIDYMARDYDSLLALDETFFRSTISAHLAYVRLLAGDPEEAIVFSATAEAIGEARQRSAAQTMAPNLAMKGNTAVSSGRRYTPTPIPSRRPSPNSRVAETVAP